MNLRHLRTLTLTACCASGLFAQGTDAPLTLQGLDQRIIADTRARGLGGVVFATSTTASALFSNPARLTKVEAMDLQVGAAAMNTSRSQTQQWVPNRLYAGLSLMMEDLWGDTKAPTDTNGNPILDPWEQLQKPLDTMGPNWSRKENRALPLSAAFAMPVELGGIKIVAAIGAAQTHAFDEFFQNNNVTSPLLGQFRPSPIPEIVPGDTLRVRWFQFTRKREGSVWGITPGVGVNLGSVSIGASATYFTGSSDDFEQRRDRGFLTFIYNRYKIQDTVQYASSRVGTSDYSGLGGTIGITVEQPRYTIALTLQIPYSMTRTYTRTFSSNEQIVLVSARYNPSRSADSVQTTAVNRVESGTENIAFPLGIGLGVQLNPMPKWIFAADYEMRNLDQVEYTLDDGTMSKPWAGGSAFRLGAEYRWKDWLALRGGYRETPQSFSPTNAALIGEPAASSTYSIGAGIAVLGADVDVAYEFSTLKYQDSWQSNVNFNTTEQQRLLVGIGYRF